MSKKAITENQILGSPMQAKEFLGVGRNEIYNLCKTKGFPSFMIGSKYYVNLQKLQDWIDKQCK